MRGIWVGIGEWISPHIRTILLKRQPSCINQALYFVLEGHPLLYGMPQSTTVIGAGCIRIVPSGKRRLIDFPRAHHSHLVAEQRW